MIARAGAILQEGVVDQAGWSLRDAGVLLLVLIVSFIAEALVEHIDANDRVTSPLPTRVLRLMLILAVAGGAGLVMVTLLGS